MKEIGAVTIAKLIEAHYEKDENKFNSYANFIAEAYEENGEVRASTIIKSRIDGSYKDKPNVISLDEIPKDELFVVANIYINEIGIVPYYEIFDGKHHRIYFKGRKEDCEKFLDNLCNSCCQLLNGKKTDFCNSCVNHKWYVHYTGNHYYDYI